VSTEQDVRQAVALLESLGYRVDPPMQPLAPVAPCPDCGAACLAGHGAVEDRVCLNPRCTRHPGGSTAPTKKRT
jgi:hypothetical protein